MLGDLKFAFRSLRRTPTVTLTAIAALALGIGANTAIFSVVYSVLLRPLPYPHSDRIVEVVRSFNHGAATGAAVTATKLYFWQSQNHSFDAMAAVNFMPVGVNLSGSMEPERLKSLSATADFFRVLGARPMLGTTFQPGQDKPGSGHFAVLSYRLWRDRFAADPTIVGRALTLNHAAYTVLGVMPSAFDYPQKADLWTPLQLVNDPADHSNNYTVIARLKPGVTLEQARADMAMVGERFRSQFGTGIMMDKNESVGVLSFQSYLVGKVRPALLVLMGAVGFVLLIACANVANLLLVRSAVRQQEIAVRTALGATGWQVARLALTESVVLAVSGAAVGVIFAQALLPLLLRLAPAGVPSVTTAQVNGTVVGFSAAVAVVTALIFGVFPAVQCLHAGMANPLRDAGTRSVTSGSARRVRQVLVIAEVAISLVLLIGAGLLIETFKNLTDVNPGFNGQNVLTMQMSVSEDKFRTTAPSAALIDRVTKRLEALPGVDAVGTITNLPTQPGFDDPFEILGRPASKDFLDEDFRVVSPGYFATLQIPVVQGRPFTERDTQRSLRVIIVNESFVRKYFPHENPLGQQILVGRIMGPLFADLPRTVVGVVGDTRDDGLNAPAPPIYFEPVAQLPDKLMELGNQLLPVNWLIRTSGNPLAMAETIRRETLAASGGIPMAEPQLFTDIVTSSIAQQKFSMILLGGFAGMAMLLGAIGLYGVISYSVAQRTRELGIRVALGAARQDLMTAVLREGFILTALGLAAGFALGLGLLQYLKSMLYGTTTFDVRVLLTMTAALAAVSLLASMIPALRAASVDPVIALRNE